MTTKRNYGGERLQGANQSPRCEHVKTNGAVCRAPALQNQTLCHFHIIGANTAYTNYQLPWPEDAASIQFAIVQVLRGLQEKVYDTKTCAVMLYALQLAGGNLKRLEEERLCEAQPPAPESREDLADTMLRRLRLLDPVIEDGSEPSR